MREEFIREIINLLRSSNIKSFELSTKDFTLKIENFPRGGELKEEVRYQEVLPPSSEEVKEEKKLHVIKSPLVGTFYRSPKPGAPPFVEVGDIVSPGQVLCIIEALKVMNEIESDVKGRVEKILVENGEMVEYGQPLFLIDTNV